MSHIKFIGGERFTDLLGVKGVTAVTVEMVAMEVKAETVEIAKVIEAVDR